MDIFIAVLVYFLVCFSLEMLLWLSFKRFGLASVQRLVSSNDIVEEAVAVTPTPPRPNRRRLVILFLVFNGVFYALLFIVAGEWAGEHPGLGTFLVVTLSGYMVTFWERDHRILGWTQQELLICRPGTWPVLAAGVEKRLPRDTPITGPGPKFRLRNGVKIDGEWYLASKRFRRKLRAAFRTSESADRA